MYEMLHEFWIKIKGKQKIFLANKITYSSDLYVSIIII